MPLLDDLLKLYAPADLTGADADELAARGADALRAPVLAVFRHHGLDRHLEAANFALCVDAVAAWHFGFKSLDIYSVVRNLPPECHGLPPRRLARRQAAAFYAVVMRAAQGTRK